MIKNFSLSSHNVDNFINKLKQLDLANVRYVASVVEKKQSRSTMQNNLYWAVLQEISNQLEVNNKKFSADSWHEYFKQEYLPDAVYELVKDPETYQKWEQLPNGSRRLKGSTTDLTTKGFSEYMEQIYAFATSEGVVFEA